MKTIFIILLILIMSLKTTVTTVLTCVLLLMILYKLNMTTVIHFDMASDANGMNEAIVLSAKINGAHKTLFMLDTGYAGPPVLSTSYLHLQNKCSKGTVSDRYKSSIAQLTNNNVTEDEQNIAIQQFLSDGICQTFTSGCTMQLVGIGSSVQQQADMFLCPVVTFQNKNGLYISKKDDKKAQADVLVTNPLPNSIHILTCDYLVHYSPCLIDMKNTSISLNIDNIHSVYLKASFDFIPAHMVGGAFVIPVVVGSETFMVTVDTGSPGPLCLGKDASTRLKMCSFKEKRRITQLGVNGEEICSDILYSDLYINTIYFDEIGIFSNNVNVNGVDGYVGMGVLRALDILITSSGIGFRKSGLNPKTNFDYASFGSCDNNELNCSL